ncbi:MAG: methyltransferase domain-containing protein [Desulfobacteraceae bacterium]|nr:methyltransferase domain-containing protein [Desulfobacteraceae bacterium]
MTPHRIAINRQYGPENLDEKVALVLEESCLDPETASGDDLTAFDELHIGGRGATLALATVAGLTPNDVVLDVGSGLGGPARTLASRIGCRVKGIDLTSAFCRTATELSKAAGLTDRVTFHHGDALNLPFENQKFDVVWNQHFAMNVEEKGPLYKEEYRVLRSGGKLALHEIVAGPNDPPYYPVPWARKPSISFLVTEDRLRYIAASEGFDVEKWVEVSEEALDWYDAVAQRNRSGKGPSPLNQMLVFGQDLPVMAKNMKRNLKEKRIKVIRALLRKP